MEEKPRPKVVLIDSDEPEDAVREKLGPGVQVKSVDLWMRTPDSEVLEDVTLAARLCGCRRVCLAVIEDEL